MKPSITNRIYIPDANRNLHTLDEWMQRDDPTTAQTVILATNFGALEIAKKDLPGKFNFEGAQKAASRYGFGFRCPTYRETLDYLREYYREIHEALRKIGGEPIVRELHWTNESDRVPKFASFIGMAFYGEFNSVFPSSTLKIDLCAVRPVRTFKK